MGNNAPYKIVRVCIVRIRMFDGAIRTLTDVRYVLKLNRKLISLSAFDSKGYRYTGECGVLKVSQGSLVVMKGDKSFSQLHIL